MPANAVWQSAEGIVDEKSVGKIPPWRDPSKARNGRRPDRVAKSMNLK